MTEASADHQRQIEVLTKRIDELLAERQLMQASSANSAAAAAQAVADSKYNAAGNKCRV